MGNLLNTQPHLNVYMHKKMPKCLMQLFYLEIFIMNLRYID